MYNINRMLNHLCLIFAVFARLIGPSRELSRSWKYLGCSVYQIENRFVPNAMDSLDMKNTNKLVVINWCTKSCFDSNAAYALIQDGGLTDRNSAKEMSVDFSGRKTLCFCTQYVKISLERCGECSETNNNACNYSLNVYEAGIPNQLNDVSPENKRRPSRVYLGCYKDTKVYADQKNSSLLKGYWQVIEKLTTTLCDEICFDNGYLYFGMTDGTICHCGDQHPSNLALLSDDKCYQPCPGNGSERCGGSWEFSMYSTGITDYRANGKFVGCFHVDRNNAKVTWKMILDRTNSPRRCLNLCRHYDFKFAGVTNGTDCICISSFESPALNYDCAILGCPGDISESCGTMDEIAIYSAEKEKGTLVDKKYIGCYVDRKVHPLLRETYVKFPTILTSEICVRHCYDRYYPFAGLENSTECFCGDEFPSFNIRINPEECNSKCIGDKNSLCGGINRLTLYETGISKISSRPRSTYIGCYKDTKEFYNERNRSILNGYWTKYEYMEPYLCDKICYKQGFLYFGLSDGDLCYCGDQLSDQMKLLTDDKCYQPCPGDSNKKCGGSWEFSLYSTGILDIAEIGNYSACVTYYNMMSLLPKIKYRLTKLLRTNSPKRCIGICLELEYPYGAVTNSTDCYCFNEPPHPTITEMVQSCDIMECSGNPIDKCGSPNYFKFFDGIKSDHQVAIEELMKSHREVQIITGSQKIYADEIIMSDNFTSFDYNLWKHIIQIADEPDYEFVTYESFSENIYIKDGKLFIKPTVRSEQEMNSGSIFLNNCTKTPDTKYCQKTSYSFHILPPIKSARIITKSKFAFRYGTMKINAKLPVGDWIVPDIWLEYEINSTIHSKIRMAFVRGNQNLQCAGREVGSSLLEGGLYISGNNVNWEDSFSKQSTDSWSNKFHTFAITWTPETIIFYIDGEHVHSIINDDIKGSDSSETVDNIWKKSAVNAQISLNIGVSVGGIKNFPDNCYSNGRPKPWRNDEAKALLKFWNDRIHWQNTWENENSALQIKQIMIRPS